MTVRRKKLESKKITNSNFSPETRKSVINYQIGAELSSY